MYLVIVNEFINAHCSTELWEAIKILMFFSFLDGDIPKMYFSLKKNAGILRGGVKKNWKKRPGYFFLECP